RGDDAEDRDVARRCARQELRDGATLLEIGDLPRVQSNGIAKVSVEVNAADLRSSGPRKDDRENDCTVENAHGREPHRGCLVLRFKRGLAEAQLMPSAARSVQSGKQASIA